MMKIDISELDKRRLAMTQKVKYDAPIWSKFMSCGCWLSIITVVGIILLIAFASAGSH
jgi:hypothetical protein